MRVDSEQLKTSIPVEQYYFTYLGEPEKCNGNHNVYFCKFHVDTKTPNLTVYSDGRWKCYACNESGDVIEFHKRINSLSFPEAVNDLASKYMSHTTVNSKPNKPKKIVATYDYENEDEEVLYQVIRFDPKDFRQMRPDGKGGWVWGLNGIEPILYRLPEVIAHKETLYICEGEKDADLLWSKGLPATSTGNWRNSFNKHLKDNDVIILPDNDEVGLKRGYAIAQSLQGTAKSIKIVCLSSLDEKGDVSDYLQSHSIEDLQKEVDECDYFDPANETIVIKSLKSDDSWGEIESFKENDRQDIPAELLPDVFGDFAKSLSIATEVPEGLAVFGVLGVISAAISHRFAVSPKLGWKEPINVYLLAALPSGNNKSYVLRACADPLTQWEKEQADKLGPEIKRAKSERKTMEKMIDKERNMAISEKDHDKRKYAIHEVTEMEAKLADPPVLPQIFVTDATPESLVNSTYEQRGRFAILGDEGGILDVISGLYNGGQANINVVLNGMDGGHVRVRRKDHSIDLNPYLTFCLFAQPVVVQKMGKNNAFTGKGMLERFLYLTPQSKLGYRTHDTEPVRESVRHAYNNRVVELLDKFLLTDDEDNERFVITLDDESLRIWREFQAEIEKEMKATGKLSQVTGWGGKIPGFALRLAGLLHVMEYNGDSLEIKVETMKNALKMASILIDHALGAFGLMSMDKATEKAIRVLGWIKANGESTFKRRSCQRDLNGQFKNVNELVEVLDILKGRNIIDGPFKEKGDGKGKPSTIYKVNPALIFEVN